MTESRAALSSSCLSGVEVAVTPATGFCCALSGRCGLGRRVTNVFSAVVTGGQSRGAYARAPFKLALSLPGQRAADASGLYYNYQREYDPAVGRCSQSDPIGLDGRISTFSYVGSRPTLSIDPQGLQAVGSPREMANPLDESQARMLLPWAADMTPGLGDVKGVYEACENPTPGNIAMAVISIGPLKLVKLPVKAGRALLALGRVESQAQHAFRHIERAGLDGASVHKAITADMERVGANLPPGQYSGSVMVDGVKVDYSSYKLPAGSINVGRITPPRK